MDKISRFLRPDKLKFLIAFLLPVVLIPIIRSGLDNDSWYVLAEGRYIAEHGIYYEDVLSMHQGLAVTVQNYGFAVIFWWIYSAFGAVGLYLTTILLNFAICFLLYKICLLLSHKNTNLSLFLMLLTDLTLIFMGFITTRAQVVSFIVILALLYILELYISARNTKLLWWIPLLSLLEVNLHASLWPMLPIILSVYILDGIKSKVKFNLPGPRRSYRIQPLVLVTLLTVAVGFLNPYGYKMLTFIFTSYGTGTMMDAIQELLPFNLRSDSMKLAFIPMALAFLAYAYADKRRLHLRHLILIIGFFALGLNSVKGMSELVLVLFFPLASAYAKASIPPHLPRFLKNSLTLWTSLLTIMLAIGLLSATLPTIANDPIALKDAVDMIDVGVTDKSTTKIFTTFEDGGYLELRGYHPYIDPRAEVFTKKTNGKADIFDEYSDLQEGRLSSQDFLAKYDFDYLVTTSNGPLTTPGPDYMIIYENSEYNRLVFRKVKTTSY